MPGRAQYDATARPDASMSLLTHLTENALDAGYAEAAARRQPGQPSRPGWLLAAGLIAVGVLLTTAAAQVRDRAPATAQARAQLSREIDARTAATDALQARVQQLRAAVTRARSDALGLTSTGTRLSAQLATLEAATGAGAVTGPGLVIRLDDAEKAKQPAAGDARAQATGDQGRVTDRDLQTIVNEVWASGAEAVSVDGQRLTALSAIRSAGEAILVDFRPLSPPYDIVAVGNAQRMQTGLAEGLGGSYLEVLHGYGITSSIETRKQVTLPAASGLPVRYASVPRTTGGTP
ncbi:MAG: hypothetical protein QOJ49_1080 [Actinomycetota bacterium]|jgi:uncharacterized protein YlxW (UPF0749 family)|nr:hypothetical protein [Actinomycetota bacterium]